MFVLVITLVTSVFGGILQKQENKFALVAFLWSVLVVGRKRREGGWEDDAISFCDIIRCISIPLFHQNPVEWILIFTTSSLFSFMLQKKHFISLVLLGSLQIVLYFLLLGLSPMTYWNFGKQFFNLVVWPDDPRQLALEMGMHSAVAVIALHLLVNLGSKLLELVRIDYLLVALLLNPILTIYLFSAHWALSALSIWYSAFLLTVMYRRYNLSITLCVMFMYYYIKTLSFR